MPRWHYFDRFIAFIQQIQLSTSFETWHPSFWWIWDTRVDLQDFPIFQLPPNPWRRTHNNYFFLPWRYWFGLVPMDVPQQPYRFMVSTSREVGNLICSYRVRRSLQKLLQAHPNFICDGVSHKFWSPRQSHWWFIRSWSSRLFHFWVEERGSL